MANIPSSMIHLGMYEELTTESTNLRTELDACTRYRAQEHFGHLTTVLLNLQF